jgi:hypothetical protein
MCRYRHQRGLPVALCLLVISSCEMSQNLAPDLRPCSEQWFQFVEQKLPTGDSEGHGPDVGSLEWRSVVEFKLGIRGDPAVPGRETDQWCAYINEEIPKSDP